MDFMTVLSTLGVVSVSTANGEFQTEHAIRGLISACDPSFHDAKALCIMGSQETRYDRPVGRFRDLIFSNLRAFYIHGPLLAW